MLSKSFQIYPNVGNPMWIQIMKGRSSPSKVVRTHLPNQLYTGERMLMTIMIMILMTIMTIQVGWDPFQKAGRNASSDGFEGDQHSTPTGKNYIWYLIFEGDQHSTSTGKNYDDIWYLRVTNTPPPPVIFFLNSMLNLTKRSNQSLIIRPILRQYRSKLYY